MPMPAAGSAGAVTRRPAPRRYGPWPGEPPVRRYGPVGRVAVLPDVHGNVPALEAVLADIGRCAVDLIVFVGDLTWGAEPEYTVDIVRELGERARCVRGNCDRKVIEFARGLSRPGSPRDRWMVAAHSETAVNFLADFPFSLVVDVTGLGATRICHGSPRADNELITPLTPADRMAESTAGIEETVLAVGHSHLRFDRTVAGVRVVAAGGVGLPYHDGPPGEAFWAILGPDVEYRCTRYDVAESISRAVRVGDPDADVVVAKLLAPPPAEPNAARLEALTFTT